MNPSEPVATQGDDMPTAVRSLVRMVKLGYKAEPKLITATFAMTMFAALPDALVALWLKLLASGIDDNRKNLVMIAAIGLGISATGTWWLKVVFDRLTRKFKDRVSVALESHVATLQASVATIEHHERPEYLDRLAMLRDQAFALDHLFDSIFATLGWIVRLLIVIVLLASVHPALILLAVFAIPTVMASSSRPMVERKVQESVAARDRQAKHVFQIATTAPAGKEVRVAQIGAQLIDDRRAAWDAWYAPLATTRWTSAWVTSASWAFFGLAYVGAIVFVAAGLDSRAGAVLLVVAAGGRLSAYIGAAVGELGFLRSFWLDAGRKLCWLEDYAAALASHGDLVVPDKLTKGITFDHVSFSYPGTDRLVLDDATLTLPAGAVVATVGENGAGKTTLVKLLAQMYAPTSGMITVDGQNLAHFAHEQWRHELAGAFQDFFRFEFQAMTSVGLGDLAHLDNRPVVEAAVDRSGAHDLIQALEHGLDTQLGAGWEGGAELSHGQWQKLALARGFMRADPLVLVLDEPTSALDAETEHALFERYATAARGGAAANGRITLLVSHRFSTVRMADLIVVLDGARVAEVGSHEQLMANGGLYSELYTIQAQAYQ